MAIASLVLGLVGLVLFCMWYVAMPCAIVGLVLAIISRNKAKSAGYAPSGMATAGMVLCIIALGLNILGVIFLASFVMGLMGIAEEASRQAMVSVRTFLG
ncbi:MAG: DUF4190 domain-containing protein [Phycisphaerae bacterium]